VSPPLSSVHPHSFVFIIVIVFVPKTYAKVKSNRASLGSAACAKSYCTKTILQTLFICLEKELCQPPNSRNLANFFTAKQL
tara:strand:+ start:2243 stop:2485 length:243 start_codon:yes stop_codon:yes gene_type:complete